jgi:hypothetical protein
MPFISSTAANSMPFIDLSWASRIESRDSIPLRDSMIGRTGSVPPESLIGDLPVKRARVEQVTENPVSRENGTIETVRKQAKQTKIAQAQFADRCHA